MQTTSAAVSVTVNSGVAQAYYIHTDQLDTPRVITDTNGNVVWQWDNSDPFGNNMANENPNGAGTFNFNLRFPGQYYDKETNLHYNVNRDYDPAIGRYVESDPIGLMGGVNTYVYVRGNPLSYVDPMGLFTPSTHNEITRAAIAIAGSPCPNLPAEVANVDWLPHSQDPKNAFWHAMRDGTNPNATPASAKQDYEAYVEDQSKSCDCKGLARALHAIEDSFARGHSGGQPWSGGLPSLSHAYHDGYPSDQERAQAVQAAVEAIRSYQHVCTKNQCLK